jgi:hypothetical protein
MGRTEPGEIDPGSQPTATHFTSTVGAPAFSGFGESGKKIGAYRISVCSGKVAWESSTGPSSKTRSGASH